MSLLGKALRVRNTGKPPIPLDNGRSARRGLTYNLGAGRADAETFMRQYGQSGTIYGIVSLLAESAASTPWNLYKKPPADGRVRYTTGDRGSDQRVQVVQHAAIQLWNNPNDWHSRFEYYEGSQQHQELTGETIWVLDVETTGFPTSMWYVRPDRMEPIPDPDNFLAGWIYTSPSGDQIPLKANEVIQEKRPDPLDPYRGAGPVASILPNIQQQRYATEYQRNLFLNGADPGGVISVPNILSDAQFDDLVDRWRESHRGVARAGQVGILENGATWTPGSHSNRDLEYGNLRLANRDELREAWRIHKSMMGSSDDVNRANAQTAEEVFVAWQVIPRLNRRRDTLNSKLLPLFGSAGKGVEFDYVNPSPENAETAAAELLSKAQAAQALVAAGYDPHDVLQTVGLPDMDVAELPAAATPPPPPTPADGMQNRRPSITVRGAAGRPDPGPSDPTQPTQPTQPAQPAPAAPPPQLQDVDAQWKAAVALLVTALLAKVIPSWRAALLTQIRTRIATGNFIGLAALQLSPDEAAEVILDHAAAYAGAAAQQAVREAEAAGISGITATAPSRADLADLAHATANLHAQQLALTAGREATRLAAGANPDADAVADQVGQFLDGLSDAQLTAAASGVMSTAQNRARLATIAAGPRAQLVATEMHDSNTCDPCDAIDGHVFGYSDDPAAVAEAEAAYPAGGYVLCEGGPRCRGTMYARYGTGPANHAVTGPQAGADAAGKVFTQLAADFPPGATAWVHHATWSGPAQVPIEHIDWTPDEMEGADPAHVAEFVAKRRAGKKLKPVILVKTPGKSKLQLVDGHHRYLAAAELGEPVRAFVGTVDADHGPWEHMHSQQYGTSGRKRPAAAATPDMAALVRRILSDGYVPMQVAGRS